MKQNPTENQTKQGKNTLRKMTSREKSSEPKCSLDKPDSFNPKEQTEKIDVNKMELWKCKNQIAVPKVDYPNGEYTKKDGLFDKLRCHALDKHRVYPEEKVKQAIKLLKEEIKQIHDNPHMTWTTGFNIVLLDIDKIFGEDLTK